jgi:hypothetical protein
MRSTNLSEIAHAACKVLKSANGKLKEGGVVVGGACPIVNTAVNKIDNEYGI